MGARRWLRKWINVAMADVVREFWPDRGGMYTCWNTKISAREFNYGTRIDYILATRGLRPWIKAADIHPDVKGSDHCPVYVDFHNETTTPNGHILTLRDAMGYAPGREPPRLHQQFT
ncbi:Endonuclease/exonuclease/phosphatase [Infundibulicybe gibba]|nr:Endonuclease/exonuclease/phosphatase [Infundibulicybe gibba]